MIKANELRIGNRLRPRRVIDSGNTPVVGYKICGAHIAYSEDELNYDWEPIPMTPELLERCGFVDATKGYRATGSEGPLYRLASPIRGQYIDLYEKCNNSNCRADGYFLGHFEFVMKYLHQLQNLYFALTGEELEIKL